MVRYLLMPAFLLGVTGCPVHSTGGGGDDDDTEPPPDGAEPDAPPASSGLVFTFFSDPELPGELSGPWNAHVDELYLTLVDLVALGDAAPGDERTSADVLYLTFDGETPEAVLSFLQAPSGSYSELSARVAAFALSGTLQREGDVFDFGVEADLAKTRAIAVSLNGVSVGPGAITYVDLAVDVRAFVDPIDWDLVQPGDDGALEVDDGDQLQSVLAGLGEAFTRNP